MMDHWTPSSGSHHCQQHPAIINWLLKLRVDFVSGEPLRLCCSRYLQHHQNWKYHVLLFHVIVLFSEAVFSYVVDVVGESKLKTLKWRKCRKWKKMKSLCKHCLVALVCGIHSSITLWYSSRPFLVREEILVNCSIDYWFLPILPPGVCRTFSETFGSSLISYTVMPLISISINVIIATIRTTSPLLLIA